MLARATALARELASVEPASALDRLLRDPELRAAHRDMLPPSRRSWIDPPEVPLLTGRTRLEEAPTIQLAWANMTSEERAACLADGAALDVIMARG